MEEGKRKIKTENMSHRRGRKDQELRSIPSQVYGHWEVKHITKTTLKEEK